MNQEEIEAFQQRIAPYLERASDKTELETVCRMAIAHADAVEQKVANKEEQHEKTGT